jgi:hypothetical protein
MYLLVSTNSLLFTQISKRRLAKNLGGYRWQQQYQWVEKTKDPGK